MRMMARFRVLWRRLKRRMRRIRNPAPPLAPGRLINWSDYMYGLQPPNLVTLNQARRKRQEQEAADYCNTPPLCMCEPPRPGHGAEPVPQTASILPFKRDVTPRRDT